MLPLSDSNRLDDRCNEARRPPTGSEFAAAVSLPRGRGRTDLMSSHVDPPGSPGTSASSGRRHAREAEREIARAILADFSQLSPDRSASVAAVPYRRHPNPILQQRLIYAETLTLDDHSLAAPHAGPAHTTPKPVVVRRHQQDACAPATCLPRSPGRCTIAPASSPPRCALRAWRPWFSVPCNARRLACKSPWL
jgi:hypothetical protein